MGHIAPSPGGAHSGWKDGRMERFSAHGIGRFEMAGRSYKFARQNEELERAWMVNEFKILVLVHYDNDPLAAKMKKFLNARQERGGGVREFPSSSCASGEEALTPGTDGDIATYTSVNFGLRLLAQYTIGLRD